MNISQFNWLYLLVGILLTSIPFLGVFVYAVKSEGVKTAILVYALAVLTVLFVVVGSAFLALALNGNLTGVFK